METGSGLDKDFTVFSSSGHFASCSTLRKAIPDLLVGVQVKWADLDANRTTILVGKNWETAFDVYVGDGA